MVTDVDFDFGVDFINVNFVLVVLFGNVLCVVPMKYYDMLMLYRHI